MHPQVILHVGLHRTGTTWLQRRAWIPELGVKPIADSAQPWDDPMLRALVQGVGFSAQDVAEEAARRAHGSSFAVLSAERLGGHPISGAYDRWAIADRLAAAFPGATVLIGTRQTEWVESLYAQMLNEGYCGRALEVASRAHWKLASWPGEYLDTAALLEGYRVRFGRDKVHELPYELLKQDPVAYTKLLASATGNEAFTSLAGAAVHVENARPKDLARQRLANYFWKSALNPHPVVDLGPRGAQWLSRLLRPF